MMKIRKILPWVLVILWMMLIFYLSDQPATESNELSKVLSERILEIIEKLGPDTDIGIDSFNHIIRKNAHFFAYLVLGILVVNGLRSIDIKSVRLALLICVLYAASDEIHQLYVPGRGGQVKDVIPYSAGALVGILWYNGCVKRWL